MIPVELLEGLRRAHSFLIFSHVHPDGDAVGSLLGMALILRALGKQAVVALQDRPDAELFQIPGADEILYPDSLAALRATRFDAIVATDASSVDRLGAIYNDEAWGLPLYVIDHHVTNSHFGDVSWVEPGHAAACQMMLSLADALKVPLEPRLAQVLLSGLVTDTLCFRTNNTTPAVLEAGMRLMAAGGNLNLVTEQILDQRPFSVLHLWGLVLDDARLEEGVIWVTVSRAQLEAAGSSSRNDGSLSSMLIRTEGAAISASFIEKLGEDGGPAVECSFRTRRGYDISGLALALGGGGHPAAGGATVAGSLPEVTDRVVSLLKQTRRAQAAGSPAGPALV